MTKHPLVFAAEALEAEAAKPRNAKYRAAHLLMAEQLRKDAASALDATKPPIITISIASIAKISNPPFHWRIR